MKKQHKVRINLANDGGKETPVLESETDFISTRLFKKLFGKKKRKILIIAPAETVDEVEIHEVGEAKQGG